MVQTRHENYSIVSNLNIYVKNLTAIVVLSYYMAYSILNYNSGKNVENIYLSAFRFKFRLKL